MPNSGMLDHSVLHTADEAFAANVSWMPAWPSRGLGYRAVSNTNPGPSAFSRHVTLTGQKRRPFSAPAELQGGAKSLLPLTPFTARLMALGEQSEEKKDFNSTLWKSAAGQRRMKGPNRESPFYTMQKPTCGYNFSRQTDHRISKLGIPYADLTRWQ